eukprot:scaffold25838_cov40-Prasinocladus_malaysianus.AAC.1
MARKNVASVSKVDSSVYYIACRRYCWIDIHESTMKRPRRERRRARMHHQCRVCRGNSAYRTRNSAIEQSSSEQKTGKKTFKRPRIAAIGRINLLPHRCALHEFNRRLMKLAAFFTDEVVTPAFGVMDKYTKPSKAAFAMDYIELWAAGWNLGVAIIDASSRRAI